MSDLEQKVMVLSDELDGDDHGNEWVVHYYLYQTIDDAGTICFDLYSGDGFRNSVQICRGYSEGAMRSLTLRLGEFIEWGQKEVA